MAGGRHAPVQGPEVRGPLRRGRGILALGATVALVVGLGAGAAYGAFFSSGSGTGAVANTTMLTVTLAAAGTATSPLLPGDSGNVVFTVTNDNGFPVTLTGVVLKPGGTITPDAAHAGCTTTDANPVVTFAVPPHELPVAVAAGTTVPIDLATAASMDVAATDACQGATFTVPITITAETP
jgi:hypothetical protein